MCQPVFTETTIALGDDDGAKLGELIEALEENDEVQRVAVAVPGVLGVNLQEPVPAPGG